MALKKKMVSDKHGASTEYYRIASVMFTPKATIVAVEEFADKAARDDNKQPLDLKQESFKPIGTADIKGGVFEYAYGLIKDLDRFKKATDV